MKYMTMQWWRGDVPCETADGYGDYYESIKARLPESLQSLHDKISLHDSKLRELVADFGKGQLEIRLDGYDWTQKGFPLPKRQIALCYSGVRSMRSLGDPEVGLGGPHSYGDLGYYEVELLGEGFFEHRMLFSSGIELQVQFGNLEIR
jgi:hypothetical protein